MVNMAPAASATVTERNLVRAEKQMKDANDKQTVDPVWAQSFNITDSEEAFDWDAFLDGGFLKTIQVSPKSHNDSR